MSLTVGQKVLVQATVLESHPNKVKVQIAASGGKVVGKFKTGSSGLAAASTVTASDQETTPILDEFQETTPILD